MSTAYAVAAGQSTRRLIKTATEGRMSANAKMRNDVLGCSSLEAYGGQIDQNSPFGQLSNEMGCAAEKHFCHFLLVVANFITMWVICGEEAKRRSSIYYI